MSETKRMTILEAYHAVLDLEDDPPVRAEVSADSDLKAMMLEEIREAINEFREVGKNPNATPVEKIKPLFDLVAYWFIAGYETAELIHKAKS